MNLLKKYRLVWLRTCGLIAVGSVWVSVNQCEAQLFRGRWQRMKTVERDVFSKENLPNDLSSIDPVKPGSRNL